LVVLIDLKKRNGIERSRQMSDTGHHGSSCLCFRDQFAVSGVLLTERR